MLSETVPCIHIFRLELCIYITSLPFTLIAVVIQMPFHYTKQLRCSVFLSLSPTCHNRQRNEETMFTFRTLYWILSKRDTIQPLSSRFCCHWSLEYERTIISNCLIHIMSDSVLLAVLVISPVPCAFLTLISYHSPHRR